VVLTLEAQEGDIIIAKAICSYDNSIFTTITLRVEYAEE
jgi:hypothetical protein